MGQPGSVQTRSAIVVTFVVMASPVQQKINLWFWAGLVGAVVGPLLVVTAMTMPGISTTTIGICVVVSLLAWASLLVGAVGKGVELGVRAANDE